MSKEYHDPDDARYTVEDPHNDSLRRVRALEQRVKRLEEHLAMLEEEGAYYKRNAIFEDLRHLFMRLGHVRANEIIDAELGIKTPKNIVRVVALHNATDEQLTTLLERFRAAAEELDDDEATQ